MDEYTNLFAYAVENGSGRIPGEAIWIGGMHKATGKPDGTVAMVRTREDFHALVGERDVHILPSAEAILGLTVETDCAGCCG